MLSLSFEGKKENQFRFRWDFPTWENIIQVKRGVLVGREVGGMKRRVLRALSFKITSMLNTFLILTSDWRDMQLFSGFFFLILPIKEHQNPVLLKIWSPGSSSLLSLSRCNENSIFSAFSTSQWKQSTFPPPKYCSSAKPFYINPAKKLHLNVNGELFEVHISGSDCLANDSKLCCFSRLWDPWDRACVSLQVL